MPTVKEDEHLLRIDKKIVEVHTDRVSSNDTPYCALELETGDWVFVWEGHWKDEEIEPHVNEYEGLYASLWVVDKSDEEDDDPWYHLKAVAPADPEEAKAMLKRRTLEKQQQREEERKKEEELENAREELFQDKAKNTSTGQQQFRTGA